METNLISTPNVRENFSFDKKSCLNLSIALFLISTVLSGLALGKVNGFHDVGILGGSIWMGSSVFFLMICSVQRYLKVKASNHESNQKDNDLPPNPPSPSSVDSNVHPLRSFSNDSNLPPLSDNVRVSTSSSPSSSPQTPSSDPIVTVTMIRKWDCPVVGGKKIVGDAAVMDFVKRDGKIDPIDAVMNCVAKEDRFFRLSYSDIRRLVTPV